MREEMRWISDCATVLTRSAISLLDLVYECFVEGVFCFLRN